MATLIHHVLPRLLARNARRVARRLRPAPMRTAHAARSRSVAWSRVSPRATAGAGSAFIAPYGTRF